MLHNNIMFPGAYMHNPQMNTYQPPYAPSPGVQVPQYPYQYVPPPSPFYNQPQVNPIEYSLPHPPMPFPHQGMPMYQGPFTHPTHSSVNPIPNLLNSIPGPMQFQSGYFNHLPDLVPGPMPTLPLSTAEPIPSCSMRRLGMKRKAIECISTLPTKIKVDEAKMSSYMNDLSLNSGANCAGTSSQASGQAPWFSMEDQVQGSMEIVVEQLSIQDSGMSSDSTKNILDVLRSGMTLEMKDEFKMDLKSNELLPKSIIDEIVKPGLQLVLWKPPGGGILNQIKKKLEKGLSEGDKESKNRKEEVKVNSKTPLAPVEVMSEDVPFIEEPARVEDLDEDMDL